MASGPECPTPGEGYLLLRLAEATGWAPTVVAEGRGVRVTLAHPVYGECSQRGETVSDVVVELVEWAFLRSRIGARLQWMVDVSRNPWEPQETC